MLSISRIVRHVELGRSAALLEELFRNGRPLPLALRSSLSASAGLAAAALGLQRVVELTYQPGAETFALAVQVAERVLAAVGAAGGAMNGAAGGAAVGAEGGGGMISSGVGAVPGAGFSISTGGAALVLALAALADVRQQSLSVGQGELPDWVERRLAMAERAGLAALREAQMLTEAMGEQLGVRAGLVGDGLTSAVLLWQTASRPAWRRRVGEFLRVDVLERAAGRSKLWRDAVAGPVMRLAEAVTAVGPSDPDWGGSVAVPAGVLAAVRGGVAGRGDWAPPRRAA